MFGFFNILPSFKYSSACIRYLTRFDIFLTFFLYDYIMKYNKMNSAFTMIELIFVIVIIGILASVAIPKLLNATNEAKKNTMVSFMGTLNRTVGPLLWANHLNEDGSIKTVTNEELLSVYTELPTGVENIDMSQCAESNSSSGKKIADITTDALENAEELFCIDGKSTAPPKFAFSADMNRSLQHNN